MRRDLLISIVLALDLAAAALARPHHPFAVTVTDDSGAVVADAVVAWTYPSDPTHSFTAKTNGQGVAKGELPEFAHPARLAVAKAGFVARDLEIDFAAHDITDGKTAEIAVMLPVDRGPDPAALYNEGVRAAQAGDHATAREKLEAAVAKKPDLTPAWSVLAMLAMDDKRYPDAIAAAEKTLALDPKNAMALRSRYDALASTNDPRTDAALDALAATDNSAEVAKILFNAGVRRFKAADRDGALVRIGQALDRDPGLEVARLARAQIYADQKRYAESLADTEALLARNPKHLDALKLRVDLCRALGDKKKLAEAEAALAALQAKK